MLELVVVAVVGVVTGGVVALKVIAPKTKSKADDKLLAFLEKVEPLLADLGKLKK